MNRFIISSVVCVSLLLMSLSVSAAVTTYRDEADYLAALSSLSFATIEEGFEDDLVWGGARSLNSLPEVNSQGIVWTSNSVDNNISTSSGSARSGNYGFFSSPHGDLVNGIHCSDNTFGSCAHTSDGRMS